MYIIFVLLTATHNGIDVYACVITYMHIHTCIHVHTNVHAHMRGHVITWTTQPCTYIHTYNHTSAHTGACAYTRSGGLTVYYSLS